MKRSFSNSRRRRGLTLVELLVVVVILVMLVAITIPLMRSIRTGSDLDAATRKIESVMSAAKTQAIASGRPASIVFMRDEQNPRVAYQIALAVSPPPYAGDFAGAQTLIVSNIFDPITQQYEVRIEFDVNNVRPLRPELDTDESTWFVRPGDTIRFNFRGHKFNISEVGVSALIIRDFKNIPLQENQLASFQIFRAPRRTTSAPKELPLGSFVILNAPDFVLKTEIDYSSGVSINSVGFILDQTIPLFLDGDVMLTFNPQGRVERLHLGFPSQAQLFAGMDPLVPRAVKYPLNPVRITVGNGSPDKPEQALGLLVKRGRENRPSRVPLTVLPVPPNGGASPGHTSTGQGG